MKNAICIPKYCELIQRLGNYVAPAQSLASVMRLDPRRIAILALDSIFLLSPALVRRDRAPAARVPIWERMGA